MSLDRVVLIASTLAAALIAFASGRSTASAAAPPRTVLTIYWSSESFPGTRALYDVIQQTLSSRSSDIECFAEFLESDRFPAENATLAFRDYIRRKYQGHHVDVVIAVTDVALHFALRYRADLFPDAPIVFSGVAVPDENARTSGRGVTGVLYGARWGETLELALKLHPAVTQVFYIAQASDPALQQSMAAALRVSARHIELRQINATSLADLIAAVRRVPPESLILYVRYSQDDRAGQLRFPSEIAPLIAKASVVPVYGVSDSYLGSGVVGGVVTPPHPVGARLAEMAWQVLDGRQARDIPIERAAVVPTFDWRQLQRWHISESRLPAASVVLNRELPDWRRYLWPLVATTLLVALQGAIIGALLVQRRNRRLAEVALRDSEGRARASYDEARELAGRLITAREEERARIARDLHDDIGQRVASLSIGLSRARRQITDGSTAPKQALSALEQQTTRLSADLRHLSHELHPSALEHLGLLEALRERCDDFTQNSGVGVRLDVSESWRDVSDAFALCLYRVAQEALRNVATHARARQVTVTLDRLDGHLTMQVTDDGCGFDPKIATARRTGLGLISLAERVRMLGGELAITAGPGSGTRLAVTLPAGESHAS